MTASSVAIVDCGLGNLFSVRQACERVGLEAEITRDAEVVAAARGVILPGVGAFGDAMTALRERGLADALRAVAAAGAPLLGVCLGMQLLMEGSEEFGDHEGLGIVPGRVRPLGQPRDASGLALKVPQVCWNRIRGDASTWEGTPLAGLTPGAWLYFVHSFYVEPRDSGRTLATTCYGDVEFCSALRLGNVFACQFHPERSGETGLRIYANFAAAVAARSDAS